MPTTKKSKIFKIVICLCLAFTFMFVQPKQNMQQAEAILPAIILAVLGSVVLDVAVDMGIKFVDKKAAKDWADNIVGKLWNKHGKLISDLKPTKMNGLKWGLRVGKGLLALIVDEISDGSKEVAEKDGERKTVNAQPKEFTGGVDTVVTDPFYNTSINITKVQPFPINITNNKLSAYFNEWVNYKFTPVSFGQRTVLKMSTFDDFSNSSSLLFKGGYTGSLSVSYNSPLSIGLQTAGTDGNLYQMADINNENPNGKYIIFGFPEVMKTYPAFLKYLERLEQQNSKTYYADGVLVTDGYDGYIDLPDNIDSDTVGKLDFTKFPVAFQNDKDFEFDIGDVSVIDAEFETINEGDEFEWEMIEQEIVNQGDNLYHYDIDYEYSPTINNYYVLSPEQQEDIDTDIGIIVGGGGTNPPATGGEGSTDGFMYCVDKPGAMVVSCKDIEAIDGSMLAYVKNSYDYAVNAVKAGVDGLNTILAGSAGLIALYANIFDWLPEEVTILLTSGLLLMIGLRVFRR